VNARIRILRALEVLGMDPSDVRMDGVEFVVTNEGPVLTVQVRITVGDDLASKLIEALKG
jgi:hypothetical protein